MLAGGSEAGITPLTMAALDATRALSRRNDDPAAASRPFDMARDGFVAAEGAGVLVLEDLERALRARRAPPLRAGGVRHDRRRLPPHRSGALRPTPDRGGARGAGRRRDRPRSAGLRERARHLDAAWRSGRDPLPPGGGRRRRGAAGRGQLDQVDARPRDGRRRRHRGRARGARDRARGRSRRRSTSTISIPPARGWTTSPGRRDTPPWTPRSRARSGSAGTTRWSRFARWAHERERTSPRGRDRHRGRVAARHRHRGHLATPGGRRVRRGADHALRHGRVRRAGRLRGRRVRPVGLHRAQGGAADGPLRPDGRGGRPHGDGGRGSRRRLRPAGGRGRERRRRRRHPRGADAGADRTRSRPGLAAHDSRERAEHGRGPGLDDRRRPRAGHGDLHGLRGRDRRHRPVGRDAPPRLGRRDAGGRSGHHDHAAVGRGLRRHAGPDPPRRGSRRRAASLRRGARRLPDRRGRGGHGPRAPRGRPRTRRAPDRARSWATGRAPTPST